MGLTPHSGNVSTELFNQIFQGGKADGVFILANMLMIALTRFIVVAHHADPIDDINKAVFVVVLAGGDVRINPPYLDTYKSTFPREVVFLIHHYFRWHLLFPLADGNNNINIIMMSMKPSKALDHLNCWRYSDPAPYKTGVGRGNPKLTKATPDAVSVFFVVRYTRHSMTWCSQRLKLIPLVVKANYHAAHNGGMCAYRAGLAPSTDTRNHTSRHQRMVTLAGQPQGWPVPFVPGISTPVNVTALFERGNSGGDSLTRTKETAAMATVPDQNPLFVCYFKNRLPVRVAGLYIPVAGVNPSARFDSLNTLAGSRLISDMRFFCARNTILTRLMAGRNGGALALAGSQSASLSTLLRPATMFDSVLARLHKITLGVIHMAISTRPQGRTSSHLKSVNKLNKPLFVWRFVSVQNSAYFTTTAASEREARLQLSAVRQRLVFVARIRLEVRHA
ncbi:host cell division inhibitor Icd-like protein [Salmonella enterica]|nr:host cell division inhibitor Icd-like protein [Salmonella enterica]